VHGQMGSGLDWVPPLTGRDIWSAISSVYLLRISSLITFHLFPQPLPWLGLPVAILSLLGVGYLRRQWRGPLVVLGAAFLVLPLLLLIISLHRPVWMPRYLLWSAAPFFVLAGLGLARLSSRMQTVGLVAIGLLAAANLAPYYHDDTKPRWDLAAAELHTELNGEDLLLVDDPTAMSLINLYLDRLGAATIPPSQWTMDVSAAATHLAGGGKVWAVQGRVGQADKESMEAFLNRIAVLGAPALQMKKGRDVAMLRFDPQSE
jgi:mannosyltransferase